MSLLVCIGVCVISVWDGLKSQLLKLFIIFPAISALAAWLCTL